MEEIKNEGAVSIVKVHANTLFDDLHCEIKEAIDSTEKTYEIYYALSLISDIFTMILECSLLATIISELFPIVCAILLLINNILIRTIKIHEHKTECYEKIKKYRGLLGCLNKHLLVGIQNKNEQLKIYEMILNQL